MKIGMDKKEEVNQPITVTLGQNATAFYYGNIYKQNGVAHINGDIRGTFSANSDYTVLNTNLRPAIYELPGPATDTAIRFPIVTNAGTGYGYISQGGAVHIIPQTNCTNVYLDTTFLTE
jgi:hypothetical protein